MTRYSLNSNVAGEVFIDYMNKSYMSIHSMSKGFPSPGYQREVTQFQWIKLDIIDLEFIELIYSIVEMGIV